MTWLARFFRERWLECFAIVAMWVGLSYVLDPIVTSALCGFLVFLAVVSGSDQDESKGRG